MKKIFLTLASLAAIVTSANAGLYSMVTGMAMKEIKPNAAYTVDTNGINPRVYEFTTRVKPIRHCVVLIASSDKMAAPTMQCWKIEK